MPGGSNKFLEEEMNKIIFIDFDGTITKVDTCFAMVEVFAKDGWEEINKLWEEKELSTQDCANMTFNLLDASIDDIKKLMESIEIDEYFKEFLSICEMKGYKIYILSDGYDLNIETIFKKYDINVSYYSNRLLYDNGFSIECPNFNISCGKCGTCKSSLMNKLKGNADQIIYIGDGYSDTCPASKADVVFAKGYLYKFCTLKGINAIHYKNFKDIIDSKVVQL